LSFYPEESLAEASVLGLVATVVTLVVAAVMALLMTTIVSDAIVVSSISTTIAPAKVWVIGIVTIVVGVCVQLIENMVSVGKVVINKQTARPVLAQVRVRSDVGVVDFDIGLFLHGVDHQGKNIVDSDLVDVIVL